MLKHKGSLKAQRALFPGKISRSRPGVQLRPGVVFSSGQGDITVAEDQPATQLGAFNAFPEKLSQGKSSGLRLLLTEAMKAAQSPDDLGGINTDHLSIGEAGLNDL